MGCSGSSRDNVDNYNHFWQIAYHFAEDEKPLLPKGPVLLITTTWDNTVAARDG